MLLAILTLLIISAITFFAMNAIPGGPFDAEKAPSPEVKAVLEARYNLDKPVPEQYVIYLNNILHGDWGVSLKTGRDISTTLTSRFGISATLGLEAAAVAGFVAAKPEAALEVLAAITPEERDRIRELVQTTPVEVRQSNEPDVFFIRVTGHLNGHSVSTVIRTSHTNVTRIEEDGKVVWEEGDRPEEEHPVESWHVAELIEAARVMPLDHVRPLLERQLACNRAIAEQGLSGEWGATIGRILMARDPEDPAVRARAFAAAASDARMNGCELPVVIVSGSGNQGITASMPVLIYAEHLKKSEEELLRALLLSDLVTVCLKQGIGKLSAYCGAVSAGAGSGAGIAYLLGFSTEDIERVISNALAITSGLICDGAKSSCASKIAMSVEGALLAIDMVKNDRAFKGGDGIVKSDVDATVAAVGRIASRGMVGTDREIINVMLETK